MSSEWELDEGIKSIKSAWWREHTARANLEKMLKQAEADNAKLRELCANRIECSETHLAERHLPWDDDDEYWLYCDECGYCLYMRKAFSRPRYCAHCGRKAVEE